MFIAASAFEAWKEHVVTVKQIVAENLCCVRQPLLPTTYIFWREKQYNLLLGQDARARPNREGRRNRERDAAAWTMDFRRTWRRNNDGYVLPTSRASAFEAWKEHVVTVGQLVAEGRKRYNLLRPIDGCLRDWEVLPLASSDEERDPEEKEAMRILKRWLRMRQMRRYALRVRCNMWKSVLNMWCKLARDAAQRVEEFEMVRSAAMWRVTRDAARAACGSSN